MKPTLILFFCLGCLTTLAQEAEILGSGKPPRAAVVPAPAPAVVEPQRSTEQILHEAAKAADTAMQRGGKLESTSSTEDLLRRVAALTKTSPPVAESAPAKAVAKPTPPPVATVDPAELRKQRIARLTAAASSLRAQLETFSGQETSSKPQLDPLVADLTRLQQSLEKLATPSAK